MLTVIEKAKFRRAVRPGDKVELAASVLAASEDGGQVAATAAVEGEKVAEGTLSFAFARVSSETLIARRREYLKVWLTGSAE